LAMVSRLLDRPLAVLIQSTSAAGKSTLMDALLSLLPDGQRVHYSAMTGQSLFYLGEKDLKHKVLAIAEEEGVRQAAYALKLLQSQVELTQVHDGSGIIALLSNRQHWTYYYRIHVRNGRNVGRCIMYMYGVSERV